nr:serpin family protein [uncultured Roseibium sp.]
MTSIAIKFLLILSVSGLTLAGNSAVSAKQLKNCDDVSAAALGELTKDLVLAAKTNQDGKANSVVSPAGFLNLTNLLSVNSSDALTEVLNNAEHVLQAGNCIQPRLSETESQSGPQTDFSLVVHNQSFQPTPELNSVIGPIGKADATFTGEILELPASGLADWTKSLNTRLSGLLGDMIESPVDVEPSTNFLLANILAFKSSWKYTFDPTKTHPAEFEVESGSSVPVAMMKQEKLFTFVQKKDGYTRVLLPFADSAYVLQLILPPEATETQKWLNQLDPNWLALRQDAAEHDSAERELIWPGTAETVGLELPRFEADGRNNLRMMMMKLGLGDLYRNADLLTGLFDPSRPIDEMTQTVAFKADETGAEAAAVTVATSTRSSLADPEVIRFDRPFFFTLNHPESGSILFAGAIGEPEPWNGPMPAQRAEKEPEPAVKEESADQGFWQNLKQMIAGLF